MTNIQGMVLAGVTTMAMGFGSANLFGATGDWPQFRGPNRDDISQEKGLLQDWPAQGPKLVWKAIGIGKGFSTVSVVGERLYTIGDRTDASFVSAMNLADGKPVWASKLGKPGAVGWGGFEGPRATPTLNGNLLFAASQWGELVCMDSSGGKEKWRKDYTKDFGANRPEWGFAESPLVDGDNVVVAPGGEKGAVVALNKNTGAQVWSSTEFTDAAHYSSLVIANFGGVKQYVLLTAAHVAGMAAKDGKLLWSAPRKGQTAVIPTPICSDDMVYVTSGYGVGCNLFRISGTGDSLKAEQVYANKVMANHHGGVVKIGEDVYGYSDGKGWTCQNFKSGEAVWQEKSKLGKGSITYADGRLYCRQEDKGGTVVLLEASPNGYKEHGRFNPPNQSPEHIWPHPVVAHGKLFLRDQDVLLCYDVKGK